MGRKSLPGLAGAEGRLGCQAAGDPPLASASEPGCLLSVWKVGFFPTLQHQIFFFFFLIFWPRVKPSSATILTLLKIRSSFGAQLTEAGSLKQTCLCPDVDVDQNWLFGWCRRFHISSEGGEMTALHAETPPIHRSGFSAATSGNVLPRAFSYLLDACFTRKDKSL